MTKTRGSRRISSRSARFRASRYVITAISRLLVDVGEEPVARWLRRGVGERHGGPQGVGVVLEEEDHRRFPKGWEFHGFLNLPLRRGAVAEVPDEALVPPLILEGEGDSRRDRQVCPDDGVAAEEVGAPVEQ